MRSAIWATTHSASPASWRASWWSPATRSPPPGRTCARWPPSTATTAFPRPPPGACVSTAVGLPSGDCGKELAQVAHPGSLLCAHVCCCAHACSRPGRWGKPGCLLAVWTCRPAADGVRTTHLLLHLMLCKGLSHSGFAGCIAVSEHTVWVGPRGLIGPGRPCRDVFHALLLHLTSTAHLLPSTLPQDA